MRGVSPSVRISPFQRLWLASAVSQLGDGIRVTALPLLAAALTTDPLAVAAVTAAVWAPWLVLGPIGGVVVDRVDRRRLMVAGQFMRTAVMVGLGWAALAGLDRLWLLVVVAFLIGVGEVFVDSAFQAMLPQLVPEAELDRANGRLTAAQLVGNELVGPPVGGALFALARSIPFFGDAASFAASGLLLGSIPGRFAPDEEARAASSAWADLKEGLAWLFRHEVMRSMAIALGVTNLGFMAFGGIYVLFAEQVLRVGPLGFGLLFSSTAAGGLLGSLMAGRVTARIGRGSAVVAGLASMGAGMAAVGLMSNAFAAGALLFLVGVAVGVTNVAGVTLRQVLTPNRLLGRVVSSFRMIGFGMIPAGAALGGWLARASGLRAPFLLGGGLCVATALVLRTRVNERSIAAARGRHPS